jgi:hypothetical protein
MTFDDDLNHHIEKMKNILATSRSRVMKTKIKNYIKKIIELKEEKDKANKIHKYHDKYRSTKLH